MFFTYADKQNNSFFGGWSMRAIAFDVMRRHLYYSAGALPENAILPPNGIDRNHLLGSPVSPESPLTESNGFLRGIDTLTNPSRPPLEFSTPPPSPSVSEMADWKMKLKIDMVIVVGKEHQFVLEDSHLKERDLYQVELHGDTRPCKSPPSEPLLCPSAGFAGMPQRMTFANEDFIRDPLFMRELYESLRAVFSNLRLQRVTEAAAAGIEDTSEIKYRTLDSPRSMETKSSRKKIILRFRTDYEFRRFVFVVQTVIGYDKIIPRPFRGLPPYDPRNGIIFSAIPMYVWHTFKTLDRAVIYSFLRGDLVGREESGLNNSGTNIFSSSLASTSRGKKSSNTHRDSKGDGLCTSKGLFLCISHDTVFVMNESGHIVRWVHLNHVSKFCYNITGDSLYFAFISDDGYPDIVFLPQPPSFGEESLKNFCPVLEVLRVQRVIHEACFASVVERRVIELVERRERCFNLFVKAEEEASGRQLQFFSSTRPDGMVSCPLPKEQLGNLWREVQRLFAERGIETLSNAAVPLYDNNTNEVPLTRVQMEMLTQRLNRERGARDQIVGVSYAQAQRIELNEVANTVASLDARGDVRVDDEIYYEHLGTDLGQSAGIGGSSFPFQPAQYITSADLASSHSLPPNEIVADHHAILTMASTPQVNPLQHTGTVFTIDGLMATSFSAYHSNNYHLCNSRGTNTTTNPKSLNGKKKSHSHTSKNELHSKRGCKAGRAGSAGKKSTNEVSVIPTSSLSEGSPSINSEEYEGGLET